MGYLIPLAFLLGKQRPSWIGSLKSTASQKEYEAITVLN